MAYSNRIKYLGTNFRRRLRSQYDGLDESPTQYELQPLDMPASRNSESEREDKQRRAVRRRTFERLKNPGNTISHAKSQCSINRGANPLRANFKGRYMSIPDSESSALPHYKGLILSS